MRSHGVVASTHDLGAHDHVCWIYDGEASFLAEAARFLEEGVRLGQRVVFVGQHSLDELRGHFRKLGDLDALCATGHFAVESIIDVYEPVRGAAPATQARVYAAAVANAQAAGFEGVRVAADCTALVVGSGSREEFATYEHAVDRLMADGLAFSAMCGYDGAVVDAAAVRELAAIHPLTGGTDPTFALFALDARVIAIVGEIDAMNADTFGTTIRRVLATHAGTVTVDGSGLVFIDHNGLLALDRTAHERKIRLHLTGAPRGAGRLRDILPLRSLDITTR